MLKIRVDKFNSHWTVNFYNSIPEGKKIALDIEDDSLIIREYDGTGSFNHVIVR